jgi:hypothetical protein
MPAPSGKTEKKARGKTLVILAMREILEIYGITRCWEDTSLFCNYSGALFRNQNCEFKRFKKLQAVSM